MPQQPQPVLQVALDPNVYATTLAQIVFDAENFYVTLISGNQGRRFQFSPKHAKQLLLLLQKQMELFEKQNGEQETELPAATPDDSPQTGSQKIGFQAQGSVS